MGGLSQLLVEKGVDVLPQPRGGSTSGNWRKRPMSTSALSRPRAVGSRQATGLPSRVMVTHSPAATRSRTRPP